VRTSASLDRASRTLLTEIHLPNQERTILPGMYVQVKLALLREEPAVMIPARTLAMLNSGPHVVTVEPDDTIRHRPVTLGRDFGAEIEVDRRSHRDREAGRESIGHAQGRRAVRTEAPTVVARKNGN
jgi:multidrug efflux pump subunit AcrA (membrane-fusion protein)